MKRILLLAASILCGTLFGETNSVPWRLPLYSLNARQMEVRSALETFGVAEGVPIIMSEAVTGVFSGSFADVPATEFLDRLATVHNLVWYYDGATIFVNASSETTSMLLDLKYMKAGDVLAMLRELGVEDRRFPIKTAQNGELIMVSGPPRYVQLVAETIARADRLKESRTFNEVEVRLFPLHHTWADNTSFSVSTPESSVTIKGVAYLLDEIMNSSSGGGKTRDGTNSVENVDRLKEDLAAEFHPLIRPENRLNAVMVRDVVTRMPMYERLIRELDVPQKLVEIAVTSVELSKKDALDWQLSLSVKGAHGSHDAAVGQNVDNLMTPDALGGTGLAGAYSYIDRHVDVNASIAALKQKGKARSVSRTSIITLNNIAASLSDTRSFQARLVGEKVANLQSVSAGTTLKVKPRIAVPPAGSTNVQRQVWLSLELQDGGFDAIAVDNMPMTSATTLQTIAAVFERDSLLLAGYFHDVEEDGGWGIPFLRDIPWIGWIFGGYSKNTETVQRLFVLTPHVIDAAYYNCTSQDVVSVQMLRQRDIAHEQELADQADRDDAARTEREERLEEKTAVRHEEDKESLKRFRKERDFRSEQRHDAQKAEHKVWEEDFKARKEAYEESRK